MLGSQASPSDDGGTWLGKYELLRKIAVGGMAELYVARVTGMHGFEKLVALKRILDAHQGNHEFIQMLMDEARLAANLDHPNIAPVYDFGRDGSTYFFTMEYVRGKDLRQLVRAVHARSERVPLEHILTIATGIAAGLHYAHELCGPSGTPLGVVHRDVSPSNLLVTYDGGVKLVDFGIAKAAKLNPHESADGTIKGKISYMSPEQVRGAPLDRRSDIYALGIILWELTTHSRLYRGGQYEVLERIASCDAPPPSSVDPNYPPDLEPIIMKALARDPQQRYANAEALQLALEDFAREQRYSLSSAKLAQYMREVFGEQIEAERSQLMEASGLLAFDSHNGDFPPTTQLTREQIAAISNSALQTPELRNDDSVDIPGVDAGTTREEEVIFGLRSKKMRRVALAALVACALLIVSVGALFAGEPTTPPQLKPQPAEATSQGPPAKAPVKTSAPASPPPEVNKPDNREQPEESPEPQRDASPETPLNAEPEARESAENNSAPRVRKWQKRRKKSATPKLKKRWDPDSPLPPM